MDLEEQKAFFQSQLAQKDQMIQSQTEMIKSLQKTVEIMAEKIAGLQETVNEFQRKLFGTSSEKSKKQSASEENEKSTTTTVKSHSRTCPVLSGKLYLSCLQKRWGWNLCRIESSGFTDSSQSGSSQYCGLYHSGKGWTGSSVLSSGISDETAWLHPAPRNNGELDHLCSRALFLSDL